MKRSILYFLTIIALIACAVDVPDDGNDTPPVFGSGDTLDILTWNVEQCPINGNTTITYLKDAVLALQPDIIAFQEMTSESPIRSLANKLPNYDYAIGDGGSTWRLAFLYNTDNITLSEPIDEILSGDQRRFPRPPLVLKTVWNDDPIIVINNHLKASGDGNLDTTDSWDEETRRRDAVIALDEYIVSNFPDDKVIILGDMNDELTDQSGQNVFNTFLNAPENYAVTDLAVANGNSTNWSYPSWPSHIDHIIISNELFDDYDTTKTVLYDTYLEERLAEYYTNISDHRPVGITLIF